jgi:hypothetical protein
MEWRQPSNAYNIVRDWNKAQGMTHVSDEYIQLRRDLNIRHISVENSSERPIGVAIATYFQGPIPDIQFILQGGEIKDVGVNSFGGPMQFIHILDPITRKPVGTPGDLRTDCSSFVLRDGVNKWFVHNFKKSGFKGSGY